jgi:hypothetical protein
MIPYSVVEYQRLRGTECEDGGIKVLRNIGILPQHYTALQLRRPRREFSSQWKPQTLRVVKFTQAGDKMYT